ncbi:hypothetical protein [Blastomonas sp. CCH1-A6]|uniref:hypothetical protein n=1 Tax=Blastomonas sp. CCH1-A6 TaxID=1768762 RepID=UPI00082D967E
MDLTAFEKALRNAARTKAALKEAWADMIAAQGAHHAAQEAHSIASAELDKLINAAMEQEV